MVLSDLEEPGVEDIIRKVMIDIENRGVDITASDIRLKLDKFQKVAVDQIANK